MQNMNCTLVFRCHLLKCPSHLSCSMCACVRSVSLSSCQNVTLIMWNNVSSPLPLASAAPLLSCPPSSNLAVCGTQWIPTLHCSAAVRPNQRPDLYWFSATCARRLAAARTPCSLPPSLPRVRHCLPGQLAHSVQCSPFVTNCQRLAGQWCVARWGGGCVGMWGGDGGRGFSSLQWDENHIPLWIPLQWGHINVCVCMCVCIFSFAPHSSWKSWVR